MGQRSDQVQKIYECVLNTQPQPVRIEARLSERNRSTKERFERTTSNSARRLIG